MNNNQNNLGDNFIPNNNSKTSIPGAGLQLITPNGGTPPQSQTSNNLNQMPSPIASNMEQPKTMPQPTNTAINNVSNPFDIGMSFPANATNTNVNTATLPSSSAVVSALQNTADSKPFTNETGEDTADNLVSVGKYLKYIIIFSIPIVGIIIMLKYAFDKNINKNIANFAKAYLIIMAITTILGGIMTSMVISFLKGMQIG